jgi:hypothetical protein
MLYLYGGENWAIKAKDVRRITAAEMKYMSKKQEYSWKNYTKKNCKEVSVTAVLDKI